MGNVVVKSFYLMWNVDELAISTCQCKLTIIII